MVRKWCINGAQRVLTPLTLGNFVAVPSRMMVHDGRRFSQVGFILLNSLEIGSLLSRCVCSQCHPTVVNRGIPRYLMWYLVLFSERVPCVRI